MMMTPLDQSFSICNMTKIFALVFSLEQSKTQSNLISPAKITILKRLSLPAKGGTSLTKLPTAAPIGRSEEHTSELQSLMRISYAVFCLKKKKQHNHHKYHINRDKCISQCISDK